MFVLAEQFFSREVSSKAGGRTTKVGATIKKKIHGYFQFHVYKQRMQRTVTSSYFLEGRVACYCNMAALAHWTLYLPPSSKNEPAEWLIEGRRKRRNVLTNQKILIDIYVDPVLN